MGLLGGLKQKAAEFGARRAGKGLSMGAVGKFLLDHKKTIGAGFGYAASWVWWQDCGVVAGIDILAALQRVYPKLICLDVASLLKVTAAFLFGMGVSDPQEWLTNFMGLSKEKKTKPVMPPLPVPVPGK